MHFRTITASATALALGLTLAACSSATPETPAPEVTQTQDAAETPSEPTPTTEPEPTPEPVDPSLEVTIDGVTYTGTEATPLKIGSDTPGQPPAAEAGFPEATVDGPPRTVFEAGEAISEDKYFVYIFGTYNQGEFAPDYKPIGYMWGAYAYNEYGSFKALTTGGYPKMGQEPFPSVQAAIDAPKFLHDRQLDRSEYVLRTSPNGY